jgi:pantetheine-phosphate adenylyltransferase
MAVAIYPGSFDPVTNGHLDIIERAAPLFEHLIVAVAPSSTNPVKAAMLSPEERVMLLLDACGEWPNVSISSFEGLLVEYAQRNGARVIIKGLRAVSDFDFEFAMAHMNKRLATEIETLYMAASPDYSFLSSTLVKEIARLGGSIAGLVPPAVERALAQRLNAPSRS